MIHTLEVLDTKQQKRQEGVGIRYQIGKRHNVRKFQEIDGPWTCLKKRTRLGAPFLQVFFICRPPIK